MKKIFIIFISLLIASPILAQPTGGDVNPKWQEVDNNPNGRPRTIVAPNGSLSFNGNIMSLDIVSTVSADNTFWHRISADVGLTGNKTGQLNFDIGTGALSAGAITGTSFIIGANTLNTTEWAFLDGQNQSVFTTSVPTFAGLNSTGTIDISAANPIFTLTDTTASAKSLKIDVDGNKAQIREKAGAANSFFSLDLATGHLGWYTTPPTYGIWQISRTLDDTLDSTIYTGLANFLVSCNTVAWSNVIALVGQAATSTSTGNVGALECLDFFTQTNAGYTGTVTNMKGIAIGARNNSAGANTITNMTGVEIYTKDDGGGSSVVTRAMAIKILEQTGAGIVNSYGIKMLRDSTARTRKYGFYYGAAVAGSEPTGSYAIYADTDNSYFGGKVGIGIDPPTAMLHLKAGTASANTAPLKFNTGTVNTIAEAGAVEFTTDDYYATITTGAARKGIILNDGTNLTSGRVPFATTNGRITDDSSLTYAAASGIATTKPLTFTAAASGVVLKRGANGTCGTFVANGVTPVTVSNTNVATTDTIIISLNTVGGTVGVQPHVATITAATGFTVVCTALDSSTYNYALIKNAA